MIIKIMMWLVVAIALAGAFLNTRGKWQGFLLWLVSNAWWCGYNIWKGEYPQAFLFGVFWFLSLYGIFQWRKTHKDFEKEIEGERQLRYGVVKFNRELGMRLDLAKNREELSIKELSRLLHQNNVMRSFIGTLPNKKTKGKIFSKLEQKG